MGIHLLVAYCVLRILLKRSDWSKDVSKGIIEVGEAKEKLGGERTGESKSRDNSLETRVKRLILYQENVGSFIFKDLKYCMIKGYVVRV